MNTRSAVDALLCEKLIICHASWALWKLDIFVQTNRLYSAHVTTFTSKHRTSKHGDKYNAYDQFEGIDCKNRARTDSYSYKHGVSTEFKLQAKASTISFNYKPRASTFKLHIPA